MPQTYRFWLRIRVILIMNSCLGPKIQTEVASAADAPENPTQAYFEQAAKKRKSITGEDHSRRRKRRFDDEDEAPDDDEATLGNCFRKSEPGPV